VTAPSAFGVGILGTGHSLGSRVETNEELCARTLPAVTPAWIVQKTGIRRRRLVADGETASSLTLAAARGALERAGIGPDKLDLVIVSTFSAEYLFPPASARLCRDLGARRAQVFDLQANCVGFVTGLTVASDRLFRDDELRHALVVGAEICSPWVDRGDVETAISFSDGAGAAVLGRVAPGKGILASTFLTDTSNFESVRLRGAGFRMEMNGLATWKQAVTHLPSVVRRACEKAAVAPEDVHHFVFHQANLNLINYVMQKLKLPAERAITNVQEVGNAGAASIPIALSEAVRAGVVRGDATLVLAGIGAGFNFGASVWRWP
jgi:3-oxoacyl-[acyl-carrier-protein] synthase III